MTLIRGGAYCFILHSRTPNSKLHKAHPETGLPACGARVGTDALEHTDDGSLLYGDHCKRCFKGEESS